MPHRASLYPQTPIVLARLTRARAQVGVAS